ncbi:MAG TPA: glycosyltransferase family 39 protein [Acidobacteriota bacterium]
MNELLIIWAKRAMVNIRAAGVLIFSFLIFSAGIWTLPLHEPDEGRYVDIAAAMSRPGGDWLTPRLNGIPYYEKPPLFFWIAAASMKVFGVVEWAGRLPALLAALSAVALVIVMGKSAFGPRTGRAAGLIMATSPLVMVLAHFCFVDVLLLALLTGALAALFYALIDRAPGQSSRRLPVLAFWALLALATMTKGPIGVAIPVITAGCYLLVARDKHGLRGLVRLDAIALYFVIASPWFIMMALKNPGFARAFFIEENLERFVTGGNFQRQGPWWYYFPVLAGTFFPWALALGLVAKKVFRQGLRVGEQPSRARLFFVAAVVGPFLLLSFAQSKLGYYILPLFPPLALLTADAFASSGRADDSTERNNAREFCRVCVMAAVLAGALGLAFLGVVFLPKDKIFALVFDNQPYIEETRRMVLQALLALQPLLSAGCFVIAVGALAAYYVSSRRTAGVGITTLACVLGMVAVCLPFAAARAEAAFSERPLARAALPVLKPDDLVVLYTVYYRTVPFYLDRQVVLWNASYTEFGHRVPAAEASGRALQENIDSLRALLADQRRVVLIVKDERCLRELQTFSTVPLYEVARLGSRRIVATRP